MEALRKNYNKIISLKQAKNIIILLLVTLLFNIYLFSLPVLASIAEEVSNTGEENQVIIEKKQVISVENNIYKVKKETNRILTAYTSEIFQTDDTPCITANGFDLCKNNKEDSIAANFLPFGAKVRIPELFGDKVFIVRDRMHPRFHNRVDVWMIEKHDAIHFGVKSAKIQVLE